MGLEKDINKFVIKSDKTNYELSGGQKKRLSIAMDLLVNPDMMILDEPTSGLASNDTLQLMNLLKQLSSAGKIIIASIHQPDFASLMLFDKIIIMDEDGCVAYFGKPALAADYFRKHLGAIDMSSILENTKNPGVILNLLESKVSDIANAKEYKRKFSPKQWYELFRNVHQNQDFNTEPVFREMPKFSFIKSTLNYLSLGLKIDFRNKTRSIFLLLIPLLIGLGFSYISRYSPTDSYEYFYNPNLAQWILVIIISSVFIGLVSSAHEFISLRGFHKSEHFIANKGFSLILSKLIKSIFYSAIQSLLIIVPSIYILEMKFHFASLFLIIFLVNFWGNLIGLILSKLNKTTASVYLIIPLIVIPQMIFSGAIIKFSDFNKTVSNNENIPLIAKFIPTYWAMEALMVDFTLKYYNETEQYQAKVLFYESVYYIDCFLPELKDIKHNDSEIAAKIIANERERNTMFPSFEENPLNEQLDSILYYYLSQQSYATKAIDLLIAQQTEPDALFLDLANKQLTAITTFSNNAFVYAEAKNMINRNYMNLYIPSYYTVAESQLFIGQKTFAGATIKTLMFNSYALLAYNLFLMLILLVLGLKIRGKSMKN